MGAWETITGAFRSGNGGDIAARPDARRQVEYCIREHVRPALEAERERLAAAGFEAWLDHGDDWVELSVMNFNGQPLRYAVHGAVYKEPVVNLSSLVDPDALRSYGRIRIRAGGSSRQYAPRRCHRDAIARAVRRFHRKYLMRRSAGA